MHKTKNYLKCFRSFTIFDYDKEEKWLRKMHQNGWKLKPGGKFLYTFYKCENEDAIYKIDFQRGKIDKNSYLKMFDDFGWEYVREVNNFYYFRKKINNDADIKDEEFEIFSDENSKLEILKHVLKYKMLPVLAIFLLIVIPNVISVINGNHSSTFMVYWCVMFLLYLYMFVRCFFGYKRNKKNILK